jgi:hypothetical protein
MFMGNRGSILAVFGIAVSRTILDKDEEFLLHPVNA